MGWTARSSIRVDLAGGTLDCWPLYMLVGGAQTTNLSLSLSTSARLQPRQDQQIHIAMRDLHYAQNFTSMAQLLECSDSQLALIKAQLRYWKPLVGFELETSSESPMGAGLGGSSSLCISMIKVFSKMLGVSLSTYEAVELAHNLEVEVLRTPTGTQDYFPALEPGLSVIHYEASGLRLEKLAIDISFWSDRMVLVYTGQPHHSGLNNWQVIKSAIEGDPPTLAALSEVKKVAELMAEACRQGHWPRMPELFQAEFEARVRLSSGFSSSKIEKLRSIVLSAGAEAVKICGAGGGGCVLVWTPPHQKGRVIQACRENGYQVLDALPVRE